MSEHKFIVKPFLSRIQVEFLSKGLEENVLESGIVLLPKEKFRKNSDGKIYFPAKILALGPDAGTENGRPVMNLKVGDIILASPQDVIHVEYEDVGLEFIPDHTCLCVIEKI